MSVYFIRAGTDGPIKIGTAENARKRLRGMQTGSPLRLSLIAEMAGGADQERALHRQFSSSRRVGEWFEPSADLLAFIGTLPPLSVTAGRKVSAVARVVEQLGGRHTVAARYEVTYKAVGNWCSWNAFPQRLHLRVAQDCQAAGIDLPADFFNEPPQRAAQ